MTTDLVVRAQGGDEDAFMALAESVADRFHAVADRILRDSHLAEDATQQALMAIWRDLPRLRDPSRFEAWSYRLLVNACYSEVRRRRRRLPTLSVEWSHDSTGDDEFSGVVDRDQLDRGFRRLSVEHRAILVLHHYLGMTLPQIADALDVPIGTVNSRLSRAVGRMRMTLQADAPPAAPRTATQEVER
jgi:RNA polymerase sigma factor (sigma-70 family)